MQNQTYCKKREKQKLIFSPVFFSLSLFFFLFLRRLPFVSQGIIHSEIELYLQGED